MSSKLYLLHLASSFSSLCVLLGFQCLLPSTPSLDFENRGPPRGPGQGRGVRPTVRRLGGVGVGMSWGRFGPEDLPTGISCVCS